MTIRRYVFTPEAAHDLDDIWEYIALDSIDAADRVITEIRHACKRLSQSPGIGHAREDITMRPVKFWGVFSYLIVYDPASSPLVILAVLHGARDVESLLTQR